MEAPKCSYCGKKEWRHVCSGVSLEVGGLQYRGREVRDDLSGEVSEPSKAGKSKIAVDKAPKDKKPVFDRKAYQREYVREWRKRRALKRKEVLGDGLKPVEVKSGGE